MYDTVGMRLLVEEGRGINPLEEVPPLLDSPVMHCPVDGGAYASGWLGNLHITVDAHFVKVTRGSLCKWHLGDNLRTLDRKATQEAIGQLSDTLHLPMDEAEITRLDFGTNLIMQHPVSEYLGHLGALRHYRRTDATEAGSLYYMGNCRELNFYDKHREQTAAHEPVPEPYAGRSVLRYEMRITGRVVRRKSDLYRLGVLLVAEAEGGKQALIRRIKRMQADGKLTKKQAHDLKDAVDEAYKPRPGFTSTSEAIEELDGKVSAAANMY